MVAGELVAEGSPGDLKNKQTGHLLEFVVDQPQRAADVLKSDTERWRVSLFGDRLHVISDEDPSKAEQSTKDRLESNRIRVLQVREGRFSMEDVFISIVQKAREQGKVAAAED
jgi:ABC-2 type transport system ATP-binding protein